jgi:ATP-dependent Clp protease adaptor protein ClpS
MASDPKKPEKPNAPPSPPAGPPEVERGGEEQVDVKDRPKSATPRRYRVIFHNDDYTTMEFVVDALIRFFHKSEAEATHIMLTVHKKGSGTAGVYTRDVAETKVEQVMNHAREFGMPLLVTAEAE